MFHNPLDNRSLYNIYDFAMRAIQPYSDYWQHLAKRNKRMADNCDLPMNLPYLSDENKQSFYDLQQYYATHFRRLTGMYYVAHMLTEIYDKPKFDITEIKLNDEYCEISEEIIDIKSFCNLINFKKQGNIGQGMPKILLVAPMSGHYATLLRDTVRDLLPYYDVYITDWQNARDVPLTEGSFDLDDFVDYLISYFQLLGPDLNVMAVCQPTVPVLVALSVMSTNNDPRVPSTAILLGGPIDTTQSPTKVNELAMSRGDDWFQQNVISMVPTRFKGGMRLVYPGFMQLAGFMSMNIQRHIESLQKAIENYAVNRKEEAFKTIRFYLEYFSTMDLTAEFYMQTINTVFQEQLLTKGRFKFRGEHIRMQDIKQTAILAIEGGRDDITGVGQTKSVLNFCKNLPDSMKKYYLADTVGHYGLFNGSQFRKIIIPEMNAFIAAHQRKAKHNEPTKSSSKSGKKE